MRDKYDLIVPFGFNCASAAQLRLRNLRFSSFPFDWISENERQDFGTLLSFINSRFKDFLSYENLQIVDPNGGNRHVVVKDLETNFCFSHDFYIGAVGEAPRKQEWTDVRAKYQRRIDRLFEMAAKAESILFVSNIGAKGSPVDHDNLIKTQRELQSCFCGKQVDLFVVAYESDAFAIEEIGDNIVCQRTSRQCVPAYDVNHRVIEFSFLDKISLTSAFKHDGVLRAKRELNFVERLVYNVAKRSLKVLFKRKIKFPVINDYE